MAILKSVEPISKKEVEAIKKQIREIMAKYGDDEYSIGVIINKVKIDVDNGWVDFDEDGIFSYAFEGSLTSVDWNDIYSFSLEYESKL